jgi:hypothetical protein
VTVATGIFLVVLASGVISAGAPTQRIGFGRTEESLVIQFCASASVAKPLTCISGRSGNVTMTSHPGPAFTGRVSNLILATDLVMVILVTLNARSHALKIQGVGAQANRLNV